MFYTSNKYPFGHKVTNPKSIENLFAIWVKILLSEHWHFPFIIKKKKKKEP